MYIQLNNISLLSNSEDLTFNWSNNDRVIKDQSHLLKNCMQTLDQVLTIGKSCSWIKEQFLTFFVLNCRNRDTRWLMRLPWRTSMQWLPSNLLQNKQYQLGRSVNREPEKRNKIDDTLFWHEPMVLLFLFQILRNLFEKFFWRKRETIQPPHL